MKAHPLLLVSLTISGTSYQLLHGAIWQHLLSVLFLLLSLGAGLGTATAQAQTRAYVTNTSGTVSVIETATNSVVATIPVGIFPSGVAITPDGTRAYVANIFNSISVIDSDQHCGSDGSGWSGSCCGSHHSCATDPDG